MEDNVDNANFKAPGFILSKDIEGKVSGFDILLAIEKIIGEEQLESLQEVRGVWRIYPNTVEQKVDLCSHGIELNGKKSKYMHKIPS